MRVRLNITLFLVYLLTLGAALPSVYYRAQELVYDMAFNELTLLVSMVNSVREYVADDVRPVLLEKGIFHPPAVSSTVATKRVSTHFHDYQPDYYIRTAADNPLNPENLAAPLESEMLKRFRDDRSLEVQFRVGNLAGREYLLAAKPALSKPDCLLCHGDPGIAPAEITATYGSESGFHWEPDQVAGIALVGVPIAQLNDKAYDEVWSVAIALSSLFLVLAVLLNLVLRPHKE
jgi:hypothetical protein